MNSITDILDSLGVEWKAGGEHQHITQGWLGLKFCPYCGSDNYHLGYNLAYGYFSCWRDGSHSATEVIREITGKSWGEVKELLGELDRPARESHRIASGKLKLPEGVGPLLKCHRLYLRKRGFVPEEIEKLWGIKGIGRAPRFQFRIFVPIFRHGEMVSWATRTTNDQAKRRYSGAGKHEESYPAKRLLYGEDLARHAIIICEGPTDVWKIGPGAVCTLGINFKMAQVRKAARYPVRVVCFDAEPKAQQQAHKLCNLLEPFAGRTINVQLSSKDPGSATAKEINQLRRLLR